jgi:hypothetical protein
VYEPVLMENVALQRRAAVARRLLPELDLEARVLLLSYVVWPTAELLAAEREEAAIEEQMKEGFQDLLARVLESL